jgi:hypothetical protein
MVPALIGARYCVSPLNSRADRIGWDSRRPPLSLGLARWSGARHPEYGRASHNRAIAPHSATGSRRGKTHLLEKPRNLVLPLVNRATICRIRSE